VTVAEVAIARGQLAELDAAMAAKARGDQTASTSKGQRPRWCLRCCPGREEAQGGRWGRLRTLTDAQAERARDLAKAGQSSRQIAAALKVPPTTLRRALAARVN
jgi:hypothetical protein